VQWREWILQHGDKKEDLEGFTSWLKKKMEIICRICPTKFEGTEKHDRPPDNNFRRNRRYGEHTMVLNEEGSNTDKNNARDNKKCLFCS